LIRYHQAQNPGLLVEIFKKGKLMKAQVELIEQFHNADGKELDVDKVRDYADYLLQSAKGKDFVDGMYGFAANTYLKK